jgi:isocitrate dehydrogenase
MNTPSNMVKVAVVGGEGIGPEVTAQSHRILNWFAAKRGVPVTLREAQYGLIPYLATGKVLPEDTAEAMDEADAILWGATGTPRLTANQLRIRCDCAVTSGPMPSPPTTATLTMLDGVFMPISSQNGPMGARPCRRPGKP